MMELTQQNKKECPNSECIRHTEVMHGPSCPKSGSAACRNWLCLHQCWTAYDVKVLNEMLDYKLKYGEI